MATFLIKVVISADGVVNSTTERVPDTAEPTAEPMTNTDFTQGDLLQEFPTLKKYNVARICEKDRYGFDFVGVNEYSDTLDYNVKDTDLSDMFERVFPESFTIKVVDEDGVFESEES